MSDPANSYEFPLSSGRAGQIQPPASDLTRFDFQVEYRLSPDEEISRRYRFQLPTLPRNGENALYEFDPHAGDLLAFTDVAPERRARISELLPPIITEFEELAARYLGDLRLSGFLPAIELTLGYAGTIDLRDWYDYSFSAIMLFSGESQFNDNSTWDRYYFVNNDGTINLDNQPQVRAGQETCWRLAHEELDRFNGAIGEFLIRTKSAYEAVRAELRAS
jgi:hypothetical protein